MNRFPVVVISLVIAGSLMPGSPVLAADAPGLFLFIEPLAIDYVGDWSATYNDDDLFMTTTTAGDTASLSFEADRLVLLVLVDDQGGDLSVCIDTTCDTVSTESIASRIARLEFTTDQGGDHTLALEVVNGSQAVAGVELYSELNAGPDPITETTEAGQEVAIDPRASFGDIALFSAMSAVVVVQLISVFLQVLTLVRQEGQKEVRA